MMTIWSGPPKNPRTGNSYFDPVNNVQMIYVDGAGWIPDNSQQYYTDSTSTVRLDAPTAINMFEVNTPSGTIRANMATGEVFFPQSMNRSDALYAFWKGFSKVYMPNNTELSYAKQEISMLKQQMKDYEKYVVKEITDKVAEKVQKKYGNEKFIVTKPDDLVKLIKGES